MYKCSKAVARPPAEGDSAIYSREALYIPTCKSKRRKWGESSGAADYYKVRNAEIRSRFQEGAELYQLCEQYGLSIDSIRKIVYSKNPQS